MAFVYFCYSLCVGMYALLFSIFSGLRLLLLWQWTTATATSNSNKAKPKIKALASHVSHREKLFTQIGFLPSAVRKKLLHNKKPCIWIHAVSAGEIKLALTLMTFPCYKNSFFFITTMHNSGYALGRQLLLERKHGLSDTAAISFLPFDIAYNMRKLFSLANPKQLLVIEHDVWPNMLREARRRKIKSYILNFQLQRKEYQRYLKFPWAFRFVYQFTGIFGSSRNEGEKLKILMPKASSNYVYAGNLKYAKPRVAFQVAGKVKLLLESQEAKNIIVFGSSHEGEEEIFLKAISDPILKTKGILFVIIPRHITGSKRIANVSRALLKKANVGLYSSYQAGKHVAKMSKSKREMTSQKKLDILIVDAYGLSESFYALSDIVLIGDTLLPGDGGHNILEALQHKAAVLYGTHMTNFEEITPELEKIGACQRIEASMLSNAFRKLIESKNTPKKRQKQVDKTLREIYYDKNKMSHLLRPAMQSKEA